MMIILMEFICDICVEILFDKRENDDLKIN